MGWSQGAHELEYGDVWHASQLTAIRKARLPLLAEQRVHSTEQHANRATQRRRRGVEAATRLRTLPMKPPAHVGNDNALAYSPRRKNALLHSKAPNQLPSRPRPAGVLQRTQ